MPVYEYKCPECGTYFDALKKVADRKTAMCSCGTTANQQITACHFDPRMGADPDFPTFAAKWDRNQRDRATGRMKDSNNATLSGSHDYEKDAYMTKKRGS